MKTKIIYFSLLLLLSFSIAKAQTWEFVGLDSLAVYHLSVSGDTIYAGTIDRNNNPNINDGLYFTSDSGVNWVQLDSALGNGYINGLYVFSPESLFIFKAGTIFKTTNSGISWSSINNISTNPIIWFGISPFNVNEMYAIDLFFAGGTNNDLFKSTNGGEDWVLLGPFPASSHGNELSFAFDYTDSMNLYAIDDDHWNSLYFFKSSDKGNTWSFVSSPPVLPRDIYTDKIIPERIFLLSGPYISRNSGTNWILADSGLTDTSYYLSFYQDQLLTNLLYILKSDGLYYSNVDTYYWNKVEGSENLPLDLPPTTRSMKNITLDKRTNKIYLGTSNGLFRTDALTNVPDEENNLIKSFVLEQNFPNPFNPQTKIKYQLSINTHVILKVYDLLGKELAVLVDEDKSAGDYEIEFNGKNFSSSIYIYTLIAGAQRKSKKMTLIK